MNLMHGLVSLILGLFLAVSNTLRGEYVNVVIGLAFVVLGISLMRKSKHIRKGGFKPKDWEHGER